MRIVFMGSPEFAVPSLDRLRQAGHTIVGVVTAPDRPAGRGKKLRASAIKTYALAQQLPLLQPVKLRDPDFLAALTAWEPELAVVVAFRMLPKVVWEIPTRGTLNLHAALLPDYRGAAPINWVLINGETQTGLSTFMIDEKIDTGGLLLQQSLPIPYTWTAGDLHDHMMELGADLVLKTVAGLEAGSLTPQPQDDRLFVHPAPKLFKADCRIDWARPAESLYHFIRGLSPFPTAWTLLEEKQVKIFFAQVDEPLAQTHPAGTIRVDGKQLLVATQDRWLKLEELQLAGKKRMPAAAFLNGYPNSLDKFS